MKKALGCRLWAVGRNKEKTERGRTGSKELNALMPSCFFLQPTATVYSLFLGRRDDFLRGIGEVFCGDDCKSALGEEFASLLGVGAFDTHDYRHAYTHIFHGADDAFGDRAL